MKSFYSLCRIAAFVAASMSFSFPLYAQMVWNHAVKVGDSTYIAIPNSPSLALTGSFTLEAWVNTTTTGTVSVVGNNEYRLLLDDGLGRIQVNNNTRLMGKAHINNGKWNHLACVFDIPGKTIYFYVNGDLDTSGTISGTPVVGTDSVTIGMSIYGNAPAMLDEVRIWNVPLASYRIKADFVSPLAVGTGLYSGLVLSLPFQSTNNVDYFVDVTDRSGKGNNGVNRGATSVDMSNAPSTYLRPNQSLFCDGSSSYAVAGADPSLPAQGPFTLEAWIFPFDSATGTQQTIISRETSGYNGYEMYLLPTGKLAITTMGSYGSSQDNIPSERWTHVAVTYTFDGTYATTRLYINGRASGAYNASPISAVADSVTIGRSAGLTRYFGGYIDEVRMSSYAKSEDEIKRGMFTSEDYQNRRSTSNVELVYGFDGSAYPTTYATPLLTFRGQAQFSNLAFGADFPMSPLTRDPASPGSFPDGYYMRSAQKRVPESGSNSGSIVDTLNVSEDIAINKLKVFVGFDHYNESSLNLTLIAPTGDSVTLWNADYQLAYTNGVATIFDDGADSTMSHSYLSFTPTVQPHNPITAAFAGKSSVGMWRLRMTQLVNGFSGYLYGWGMEFNNQTLVNVAQTPAAVPGHYALLQGYPNPFNPTATIRYQVPSLSHVTLMVYNSLGQHVATLVDGEVTAGEHQVTLDGRNLASGVYFYRMESGSFVQTRKVVLVK
ncbi:MAG: LamG-like jellyroll fold domain-containing protein [Bacteroidota bacterium]